MSLFFWQTLNYAELEEMVDWLIDYEDYPVQLYLNGITYEFGNEFDKLFFIVGMEAYANSIKEIEKNGDMGI